MVVVGGHAKRDLRKREKRDTGKQYKGLYLPMKNSWSLVADVVCPTSET